MKVPGGVVLIHIILMPRANTINNPNQSLGWCCCVGFAVLVQQTREEIRV